MKGMQKKQFLSLGLILLFLFLLLSIQFTFLIVKISRLKDPTIASLQGPEITNVAYTPEKPEWYDNVTITAEITDSLQIFEALINYDADNDQYAVGGVNVTMSHVEDDLYTYTILNSIWDPPWGPAFGSYVNFTIYAKNEYGFWSKSETYQFYMNDTVKPIAQILTLDNNSWLSNNVQINITINEEGSGLERVNLTIYMGNGTLFESFTSTNLNETFLLDVSSLPDYNISEPSSYFTMNLTAWDKATPFNKETIILESIRIDNTPPSIAFINSYKNLTAGCQDNKTFTNNIISATNFINNYTSTHHSDSIYHSFYNDTAGFLQIAYGFNLTNWNLTTEMINILNISLEGKIGYADSSVLEAGWKIWNWIDNNFTIIDNTKFKSTEKVSDSVYLTNSNKSLYINSEMSHRIEIFFFINTTGLPIDASIDYILYNVSYYKIDEWYNRENQNITLHIIGNDLLSFDHMDLSHGNQTYYRWNTSGEYLFEFNTTALPDGLVSLNLTVYDKAGNSNFSSILLNVDYLGPIITILSPENNSYIGESQIWELIVPIELSGHDISGNFQRMELWIDGQIGSVLPGQLGQIIEYDEYGNITYEQTNATWYEEGSYTYYWNASTLISGSQHELILCSYDGFGNPNEYQIFVTKSIFITNISLVDVRENYSTTSNIGVILEFKITNYGNSTLKDFLPQLIIPSHWDWSFKDVDYYEFQYLSPGETLTFKVEIIPRSVENTLNQSIDLLIICQIVENLTQPKNNYTIQLRTYIIVQPQSGWLEIRSIFLILISIIIGFVIGLISFLVYRYLREASIQPQKPTEKKKKLR